MFRSVKGTYGSGLPLVSKGILPSGRNPQECPCEFDVFTAWEGHQIVSSFYPPIMHVPRRNLSIKVVRQLTRYPYDVEDGELIYSASNPFPNTAWTSEIISENVQTSDTLFLSSLPEGNANALDELEHAGPLIPFTVTVSWVSGAVVKNMTDDGVGGWSGSGSGSIDYCTPALSLNLSAFPPDLGSDITVSYRVMDLVKVSTRLSGTITGGKSSAGVGLDVALTDWEGIVHNNELTFASHSHTVGGGANVYYLSVDSDGAVNHNTTIQIGETLLCRVETAGGAIIDGPYDMHLLLNMDTTKDGILKTTVLDTTDFWYYGFFYYNDILLQWQQCTVRDYALTYDSTVLFTWLWDHLPRDWRTDDSKSLQQTLGDLTYEDGQVVNINEDHGKLRGQLYRFLKWFGIELERGRAYIRAIACLYLNVDRAPAPILELLADLVGITLPKSWDIMRQRAYVKGATLLWQRKGTETAILLAAYRATGIMPDGLVEIHDRLLYTNMIAGTIFDSSRTTLDTTLAGGPEKLTDPHSYAYGPTRTSHYHERGLNIFLTDLTNALMSDYTHVLKIRTVTPPAQPIFKTKEAETPQNLLTEIGIYDYLFPGSVTVYWRSGVAPGVLKSMTDDGQGGFLLTGDGYPAQSSINYLTKELTLDTRGDVPTVNTRIWVEYKSTSPGVFQRLREEVERNSAGTAHIAYYIDNALMGVSN